MASRGTTPQELVSRWRSGDGPRLVLITDTTQAGAQVWQERAERFSRLARPASLLVDLRDPELSARARLELGGGLRAITSAHAQGLAVNDRLDLALLLAADAVHLKEESVSAADARSFVGEGCFLIGAWHDPSRVPPARLDALMLSPILAPRKGRPALGLEALARFRRRLAAEHPGTQLFALGGVSAETAGSCLDAGADGVAVVGAALTESAAGLTRALGIERPG